MTGQQWIILVCAAVSLGIGLLLAFAGRHRMGRPRPRVRLVVALLVLALTPVFLIFLFFPDSTFSGEFTAGVAGGAIGAFLFIWLTGVWWTLKADELEVREAQLARRETVLDTASAEPTGFPAVLNPGDVRLYRLKSRPRRVVGLVPGGIDHVKFAQIWVSSENANMQMARFYDRAISGAIRYLGARRNNAGEVEEDLIGAALAARMEDRRIVALGTVFDTEPGALADTHGVRALLHVATVAGQFNQGYRTVADMGDCVHHVLQCAERLAERDAGITSVLLPLLGSGSARGELGNTVAAVLDAVVTHLENNRDVRVNTVYVLAYTKPEWAACTLMLDDDDRLRPGVLVNRSDLLRAAATVSRP
jgi:hypothetical protein